jgi:hypothetical protein
MNPKLPDILPPVAPLNGESGDDFGYKFTMDVSPEFAEQLEAKGQVYLEMNDGRMIPVMAVPGRIDQPEPPSTISVLFTSNTDL